MCFGPTLAKFGDNVRYAFEVLSAEDCIDAVWITGSEAIYLQLRQSGRRVVLRNSLRAVYYFFSSQWIISGETSVPKLFRLSNLSARSICVSHGYGPRSVYVADGVMFLRNVDIARAVERYDHVLFPNRFLANILGTQMLGLDDEKILLGQQPRISRFMQESEGEPEVDTSSKKSLYRIIFAPTWRQDGTTAFELLKRLSDGQLEELDRKLVENQCELLICLHFLMIPNLVNQMQRETF